MLTEADGSWWDLKYGKHRRKLDFKVRSGPGTSASGPPPTRHVVRIEQYIYIFGDGIPRKLVEADGC